MAAKSASTLDDIFNLEDLDDLNDPIAVGQTAPAPKKEKKAEPQAEEGDIFAPTKTHAKNGSIDKLALAAATKLAQIEKELNVKFLEREAEIKSLLVGLVSGWHALFLGPPGTGKSALTRSFAGHIANTSYFDYMLNPSTDPSELLGMYNIKELEKGNFSRNYAGKLPDAQIAFLDEIYKGNSAVLNILLGMLNERIWFDNGKQVPAALEFCVAASNEEPQEEGLAAFHDRLVLRHYVEYVRDPGNRAKMVKNSLKARAQGKNQTKTMITLDEIRALREKAKQVDVPDDVITAFQGLLFELEKTGIVISNRRENICFELIQAHAAIEGRDVALTDDMVCLTPVLHQRKDDVIKVEQEVLKLANPFEEKLKRFMAQAGEVYDKTMAVDKPADRANQLIDARDQLDKIQKELGKLSRQATQQGRDDKKLIDARDKVIKMSEELVNSVFQMSSNSGSDDMPF